MSDPVPDPVTPDPLAELAAAVAPVAEWLDNPLCRLMADDARPCVLTLADLRRLLAAAAAVRGRVEGLEGALRRFVEPTCGWRDPSVCGTSERQRRGGGPAVLNCGSPEHEMLRERPTKGAKVEDAV